MSSFKEFLNEAITSGAIVDVNKLSERDVLMVMQKRGGVFARVADKAESVSKGKVTKKGVIYDVTVPETKEPFQLRIWTVLGFENILTINVEQY